MIQEKLYTLYFATVFLSCKKAQNSDLNLDFLGMQKARKPQARRYPGLRALLLFGIQLDFA